MPVKGETILGDAFNRFPGAKGANQAVAAALAGADTAIVGAVGRDANGDFMQTTLSRYGIDITQVEIVDAATQVALIMVGGGDNQIIVVPGASTYIDAARIASLPFSAGDICVAQGETTTLVVKEAFDRAHAQGAVTLLNPAPAADGQRTLLPLADIIVVNETECEFFAGMPFSTNKYESSLVNSAEALRLQPDQVLVVTLGAEGLAARQDATTIRQSGYRVAAIDSTGAGDCFVGTFAAALARNETLEAALVEANLAAALSVTGKGALASFPTRAHVQEYRRR